MTSRELSRLAKDLVPGLPGFSCKGPMAFGTPVDHTLRGLYFEGSSFDKQSFYVWAFVMPLCVPARHVSFNLGRRVRELDGGERWSVGTRKLSSQLLSAAKLDGNPPILRPLSLSDTVHIASAFATTLDPHAVQAHAYALARSGSAQLAVLKLRELMATLDRGVAWQNEMWDRASSLSALLGSDPSAASRQLVRWESETVRDLQLEEFRQLPPTPA